MNINDIIAIVGAITTALNAAFLGYLAYKRLKPELKKSEAEGESELQEATNLNLEGAKISAQMLLDRINELKGELAEEKRARELMEVAYESDIAALKKSHRDSIDALEKARREDVDYFRRRIKDLERDSRDYKNWAAKLVKQVVEAGKIPVPMVPSYNDTDPAVTAIRPELETGPLRKTDKEEK